MAVEKKPKLDCDSKNCEFRFDCLEVRMDKLDERDVKQTERYSIIEKAIVEIQTSSSLIAQTLGKLEKRFDDNVNNTNAKWFKIIERVLVLLAGIITAVIGEKILK